MTRDDSSLHSYTGESVSFIRDTIDVTTEKLQIMLCCWHARFNIKTKDLELLSNSH